MSNAETIAKLNDALSKLIKAYEELQEENNGLNKTIEQLETKVEGLESDISDLEEEKSNLETELGQLNQNKKEDGSSISTMLGKIENLLGRKSNNNSFSTTSNPNISVTDSKVEEPKENETPSLIDEIIQKEGASTTESTTTVIEETIVSTSTTNLDDIRLTKNDSKPSFGNSSNTFGSNSFNSSFPSINDKKDDDDEDEGDNKLDLNRMASLLNGMNKR